MKIISYPPPFNIGNLKTTIQNHKKVPSSFKSDGADFGINNISYSYFRNNLSFEGNFKISHLESFRCPICQKIMLNSDQIDAFCSEVSNKRGEALIKALEKYENENNLIGSKGNNTSIYHKEEQEIVNIIKKYAKAFNKKDLKQIVKRYTLTLDTELLNHNDVDKFFLKCVKDDCTNKEIARRIILPSMSTKEHIIPKAKHGMSDFNNYLCDCSNCNFDRRTKPFNSWIKDDENIAQKLQNYLNDIQQAIEEDKLNITYRKYMESFIETIEEVSFGYIKLSMPEVGSKGQMIIEKMEKRKELIENLAKQQKDFRLRNKDLLHLKTEQAKKYKETLKTNDSTLSKLCNYEKMSDEDFTRLISAFKVY